MLIRHRCVEIWPSIYHIYYLIPVTKQTKTKTHHFRRKNVCCQSIMSHIYAIWYTCIHNIPQSIYHWTWNLSLCRHASQTLHFSREKGAFWVCVCVCVQKKWILKIIIQSIEFCLCVYCFNNTNKKDLKLLIVNAFHVLLPFIIIENLSSMVYCIYGIFC